MKDKAENRGFGKSEIWGEGRRNRLLFVGALLLIVTAFDGKAQDMFNTNKSVPLTPSEPIIKGGIMPSLAPGAVLKLQDAIDLALSNNPKSREDWAKIKVQAAGVGIGYSAYLPTLSGSLQGARQNSSTDVSGFPQLGSDSWANTNTESLSLSWVLYDFGGRDAALANAKALLLVAQATHEATLRDVFAAVTKDYYAAQAAEGTLQTAQENEKTANQSYLVAAKRVEKGVAPVSDELQANTVYLQSEVDLTKAEGESKIATGTLAIDLGLPPDDPIILPSVEVGVRPDDVFHNSVATLIEEAIIHNPSVQAAEAELDAAVAKVKQVHQQGFPSLSIVGKTTRSDQPLNAEVGVSPFAAVSKNSYLALELDVPFFDGFSRDYQIRQAKAQVEVQRYALEDTQQKVGSEVWTTYQTLQETSKNLENNVKLLDVAQKSYIASRDRYENGVGTMVEQLNAQSSLASAKLQWVKALADWRSSRLQLAAKLGTLGNWWANER